jgi:hypothetical protein
LACGLAWRGGGGGLISHALFSLFVYYMPVPSNHVELALYEDDMALIAMYRKATLLVSYLESFLGDLDRWLKERRFATNV